MEHLQLEPVLIPLDLVDIELKYLARAESKPGTNPSPPA